MEAISTVIIPCLEYICQVRHFAAVQVANFFFHKNWIMLRKRIRRACDSLRWTPWPRFKMKLNRWAVSEPITSKFTPINLLAADCYCGARVRTIQLVWNKNSPAIDQEVSISPIEKRWRSVEASIFFSTSNNHNEQTYPQIKSNHSPQLVSSKLRACTSQSAEITLETYGSHIYGYNTVFGIHLSSSSLCSCASGELLFS